MQKFLNITFSTMLEMTRQPVFLILLAGSLVFTVPLASTYYPGIGEDPRIVKQSVLALIFVTGLLSAALNASASVAREIRNGTALREQLRANGGWPADTNAPVANGLQPSLETKSSLK